MPRLHPLSPIFDPPRRRGSVNPGAMVGATRPTVTINVAVGQDDPTRLPIFYFDVHFSEPVTGYTGSGFTGDTVVVESNSAVTQTVQQVTGSGADYVFQTKYVAPFNSTWDSSGTVAASIPAGVATAIATGLSNEASTSTDNVITFNADYVRVGTNQLITTPRNYVDMVQIGSHLFISELGNRILSVNIASLPPYTITQTLTPILATNGSFTAVQPQGIATNGDKLYVGSVQQFRVMNVSNPAAMVTQGTVNDATNLASCTSMIYDGGYCYVGNFSQDRFTVVNVANPAAPTVTGSITSAVTLDALAVCCKIGNYVFVQTATGVTSIDVSTPATPTVAHALGGMSFFGGTREQCMVAMGNYLVVAGGSTSLYVVDASNPASMSIASTLTSPTLSGNFVQDFSWYSVDRWDTDIVVAWAGSAGYGPFLVDISDPTDPVLISASMGIMQSGGGSGWIADPPYVYGLAQQNAGLLVGRYVGPNGPARARPVTPTATVSVPTPTISADLVVPTTLTIVGFLSDATLGEYLVQVDSTHVATLRGNTGNRVSIVDVSNPASPSISGFVTDANLRGSGMAISGTTLFVPGNQSNRLTSIDASNPAAPAVISALVDGTNLAGAWGIAIVGNYAYVGTNTSRLTVVDISNPASMTVVGSVLDATNLPWATALWADGDGYVYVGNWSDDRLTVVDVTNPATPTVAGSTGVQTQLDAIIDIYRYSGTIFAACQSDRITAINVSNPAAPTITGSLQSSTRFDGANSLVIEYGYAYVAATTDDMIAAANVTNPASISLTGMPSVTSSTQLNDAIRLIKDGNYLYVLSGPINAGFTVVRIT